MKQVKQGGRGERERERDRVKEKRNEEGWMDRHTQERVPHDLLSVAVAPQRPRRLSKAILFNGGPRLRQPIGAR